MSKNVLPFVVHLRGNSEKCVVLRDRLTDNLILDLTLFEVAALIDGLRKAQADWKKVKRIEKKINKELHP